MLRKALAKNNTNNIWFISKRHKISSLFIVLTMNSEYLVPWSPLKPIINTEKQSIILLSILQHKYIFLPCYCFFASNKPYLRILWNFLTQVNLFKWEKNTSFLVIYAETLEFSNSQISKRTLESNKHIPTYKSSYIETKKKKRKFPNNRNVYDKFCV